jgi:linoleoyl-CoA desaturase
MASVRDSWAAYDNHRRDSAAQPRISLQDRRDMPELEGFAGAVSFQVEVRRRIDKFFRNTGQRQRDCPQMYVKTAILLAFFVGILRVVGVCRPNWLQALPLAIVLGLVTAAIGFNVQHDGSHHAYSNHDWVNKMMAMMLDVIGGSSYHWYWKHNVFHTTYEHHWTNTDIDLGGLGR